MAKALHEDIEQAFRSADPHAARDALAWAANRAAELMAEANRQKLTDFWKKLAAVHHQTERLDLTPELREQRGYLYALVQLSRAVRDQSDDLEAIRQVKSHVRGPAILRLLRKAGTMSHGELADALNIKPPTLTQAIRALAESRTITATVHGKFKYYSLTPLGHLVARKTGEAGALADVQAQITTALVALPAAWENRSSGKPLPAREYHVSGSHAPTANAPHGLGGVTIYEVSMRGRKKIAPAPSPTRPGTGKRVLTPPRAWSMSR